MVIIGAFFPAFSSSPSSLFLLLLLAIQSCHVTRARDGQDASSARAAGIFGDIWKWFSGDSKTTPPPSSPDYGGGSSDLVALLANYTASTAGSAPADARRFRVLQYNIKQMLNKWYTRLAGDTEVDQKRRRKELLKALSQLGGGSTSNASASAAAASEIPDVIVLNEVFTSAAQEAVEKLVDIFPYQTNVVGNDCPSVFDKSRGKSWDSVSGDCRVFTAIRGGVQIISRHPIEEVHAYVFETREGMFSGGRYFNRGVVLAKVMVPPAGRCKDGDNTNDDNNNSKNNNTNNNTNNNNTTNNTNVGSTCERRPVWVMGTHLTSAIKNANYRARQAVEITKWIDDGVNKGDFDISRTEDLVIFGGDFNVRVKQDGEEFGNLTEKLKLAVNFTSVGPFGADSYSPATNLEAKRANTEDGNDTLDLIGYKTDFRRPVYAPYQQALQLKAEKAWYWERMEDNNGYYKDISDHYPVVADFYY